MVSPEGMTASAGSSPMTDGRARPERTYERARLGRDAASGARRERRGREETRRVPRVARGGVRRGARARRVRRRTARGGGRGALPASLASFPPRGRSERKPVKRRSVGGPFVNASHEVNLKAAATSLEGGPPSAQTSVARRPPSPRARSPAPPRSTALGVGCVASVDVPLVAAVRARRRRARVRPGAGGVAGAARSRSRLGDLPGRLSPDAAASRPRVAGASPRRPRAPTWPPSARSGTCSARR